MSLLRSADMAYVTLDVPDDEVGTAIQKVATRFRKLHVVDISRDTPDSVQRFKRTKLAVSELGAMERKLDEFETLMNKYGIEIPYEDIKNFEPIKTAPGQNRNLAEEMKQYFQGKDGCNERDLKNFINVVQKLEIQVAQLEEKIEVIDFAKRFPQLIMAETGGAGYQSEVPGDIERAEEKLGGREGYKVIWGTVPTYMKGAFTRTLARVSRFNAIPTFGSEEMKVMDKTSKEQVSRVPFNIVTVGKFISNAFTKKLAMYMNVTIYDIPRGLDKIDEELKSARSARADQLTVLTKTKSTLKATLKKFARCDGGAVSFSPVATWRSAIRQERVILETMLMVRWQRNFAEIAGWVPQAEVGNLIALVDSELSGRSNVSVQPPSGKDVRGSPPTYFPTNEFTGQFQSIVDTYGIASYKEINPGLFTIITFPFLFGVMYGDMGHGFLMASFGAWLVWNGDKHEESLKRGQLGELMAGMHGARYVLFFMGLFGFYCGTIYNDIVSVPISVFSTRWDTKGHWAGKDESPYPYGVDPSWYGTTNQLQFFNSLKMKASVILGVTQMIFGISLGSLNHIHFNDYIGLIFEWIPRMCFMCCTFGYMIAIIIYKWCVDWSSTDRAPPNLIQTMIKMFLAPGMVDKDSELYEGQAKVQLILIVIALVSVPVMLFAKPIIQQFCCSGKGRVQEEGYAELGDTEMKNVAHASEETRLTGESKKSGYGSLDDNKDNVGGAHDDEEHGEHSFSDVMIHQGIHTIEFVLGCVSNTASYLRLWALSLAHAELAEVFWSKLIMGVGFGSGLGVTGIVAGYAAWFMATFAVLLCMDTMECVLHALRLHWVEFQNKFYHAEG